MVSARVLQVVTDEDISYYRKHDALYSRVSYVERFTSAWQTLLNTDSVTEMQGSSDKEEERNYQLVAQAKRTSIRPKKILQLAEMRHIRHNEIEEEQNNTVDDYSLNNNLNINSYLDVNGGAEEDDEVAYAQGWWRDS
jgi:hypothetical protein